MGNFILTRFLHKLREPNVLWISLFIYISSPEIASDSLLIQFKQLIILEAWLDFNFAIFYFRILIFIDDNDVEQ